MSTEPTMWNAIILAFVATAAAADIWWRKIPRLLTVSGFVIGLGFHLYSGQFLNSLGAAALGFGVALALFTLGAIGGGDVKLITALGAMLGFDSWAQAMEIAIFVAAGMAVIQMVRHHAARQTFRNIGEIFKSWFQTGIRAHPVLHVKNSAMIRSPFGVAAAIGTAVAVYLR